MKYYVKKSDANNVKNITKFAGDVNPNWFIEVKKPADSVLERIDSLSGDFSGVVVENGEVVIKEEMVAKIDEIMRIENELATLDEINIEDVLYEVAEALTKIPGNNLKTFDKFKNKKNKYAEIKKLKDELKGVEKNGR